MKLTIQKVTLENFKGKREMTITLDGDTRIYGKNRTGKTTIADAITWCLFGKDSKGRTQFGIKTRDEEGNEIPHLPHSVTLDISIDGYPHTIKRCLVEQWTRQNGATDMTLRAHVTECYIDGQKYTIRDYQKYISDIVSEDMFRMLTTPTYFPSMNWEEQRRTLTRIADPVSKEDIIASISPDFTEEQMTELSDVLERKQVSEYLEHLSYQMKTIKTAMQQIPVRIEEVQRSIPETPEISEEQIDNETESLKESIKSLHPDTKMKTLSDRMAFLQKRKLNIEQGAANKVFIAESDREKARQQAERAKMTAKANISALEAKQKSLQIYIEKVDARLAQYEAQKNRIRADWAETKKLVFDIDDSTMTCPTCGQRLPDDMIRENIEKMRAAFNQRKAKRFQDLTEEAEDLKREISEANRLKEDYQSSLASAAIEIEQARKAIDTLNEPKEEEPIPTEEEILAADANYQKLLSDINALNAEIEGVGGEDEERRKSLIESASQRIETLTAMKSDYENIRKAKERIEELRTQQRTQSQQLAVLERAWDAAQAYQMASDNLLERQVNKKFHMVSFRLFKTLINGTRQPYCEATVNGIPYADLNRADQINAGIDIINTLSGFFNVSVPLVIDNAEAINETLSSNNQKIELYVSEDKELQVR